MFTHYGKLVCLVCVCVCVCVCECVCVCQSPSRSRLSVISLTVAQQTPLSMESSRQEYQSGLPCLSPGDLPARDRTCISCISCIGRQVFFLPLAPPGKPIWLTMNQKTLSEATKISDHFIILPSPVSQCLLLENQCRDDSTICSSFYLPYHL